MQKDDVYNQENTVIALMQIQINKIKAPKRDLFRVIKKNIMLNFTEKIIFLKFIW